MLINIISYLSIGKAYKNKSPELNEIVGAKSSVDGCYYRAKIIDKTDEKTYEMIFIDFGFEESVNVANIVELPIHLQQVKLSWKYNSYTLFIIFNFNLMKVEYSWLLKSCDGSIILIWYSVLVLFLTFFLFKIIFLKIILIKIVLEIVGVVLCSTNHCIVGNIFILSLC